jgi:outer membrane lipoprotein SlyB
MRSTTTFALAALIAALATGCATPRHGTPVPSAPQAGYPGSYYGTEYGIVHSIDAIRAQSQTSGGGAVVGGAIGGIVAAARWWAARSAASWGVRSSPGTTATSPPGSAS